MQLWTTLATLTGNLLTLAAAVTNLAAALAQRHPCTRRTLRRYPSPPQPSHRTTLRPSDNSSLSRSS